MLPCFLLWLLFGIKCVTISEEFESESVVGDKMPNVIIHHEKGKDVFFKTWHRLEHHMIIYTYSDGGGIVCAEKIYPIKKGTLCFIGAGKYFYTMADNPDIYDRSKFFVMPDVVQKIFNFFSDDNSFRVFSEGGFVYSVVDESERDDVENIFADIEKYNGGAYFDEMVVSCCIKLLVQICKNTIEHIAPVAGAMNMAIDYINSNIFKSITIDDICEAIHMSKYHFCRRFHEFSGLTVMNYILKTRIVLAKNILLSEKVSVSDVSNRCGFSSISYFCRVFKAETGLTPLAYRKRAMY